jgi:hypothetical protein
MHRKSALPFRRLASLGFGVVLATLIVPSMSAAQQELSRVQVDAQRAENENARADKLEEHARELYSTPSRFREAAKLHQRAALIRGSDPRSAASFRSAAFAYNAARDNGLATQMMMKAAEQAALTGRIEEAADYYVDAALLAVEDSREDKVPAILSRMYAVLSAPLFPEDRRSEILDRVRGDTRVAHLDRELRVAP